MINEAKSGFSGVLDYLPIILILGIILGYGGYLTLFGALIITFIFLFSKIKYPIILGATITNIVTVAFINVTLGGKIETLVSLLFLSSLITILLSNTNIHKRTILSVPKAVSSGFITGCITSAIILIFPTLFNLKAYGATFLINFNSLLYQPINEQALCCSLVVLTIYYYLSKLKSKWLPKGFISVVTGSFINFIYHMDLTTIDIGIKNLNKVATGNFANIAHLLLFSFLIALVMIVQSLSTMKALKIKGFEKRILFLQGVSNFISSFLGAYSGSVAYIPTKENKINKLKTKIPTIIEFLVLLLFVIFFKEISSLIPVCCCSMLLIIKGYEILKQNIQAISYKNIQNKTIFYGCFLTSIYNINLAIVLSIIITLIINTKESRQK